MKKILGIVFLTLIIFNPVKSGIYGEGELKLSDNIVRYFMQYIKGRGNGKYPSDFYITTDGTDATYWTCNSPSNCSPGSVKTDKIQCEIQTGKPCEKFARKRQIKWKNGINPGKGKVSTISSKLDINELKVKLTELGFYGNSASSATTTPKITKKKKEVKKVVKKYELKGKRSIALSWEGYEDLIVGTVNFDETDYKGTLNLPLPNNDGTCDGTYSLQKDGKGTWQIVCSNNMGAAGTLKWTEKGGVTGIGRDHNDKKVKFTVSKNS